MDSVVAAGRTGILVPPGDAAAFAAAVRHLLQRRRSARQRMGREAARYARERHGLPAAAARIDALLRRVIAEHVTRCAPTQAVVAR